MSNDRRFESVYSKRVRAGKRRTYFFDVRKTKGDDFFLTLTESTRRFDGDGYERHKIFLYKEDFNRFMSGLEDAVNHIKTELMPDYDYDEFTRRQEEYEAKLAAGEFDKPKTDEPAAPAAEDINAGKKDDYSSGKSGDEEIEEDDMSW